jgi:phage shock protein A
VGIFRRCRDILSANLNDLIDRFEDPEKALRQAIRDMEQALTDALNAAAKVIANERLLARRLAEHREHSEQWLARARQAVQDGDESLARRALMRKTEHDRLAAALFDQQASLEQTSGKLRRQVEAMRVRVAEANRKLATVVARKQAADAQRVLIDAGPGVVATVAFSKFDRLCERVEASESEAVAWSELAGVSAEDDLWRNDAECEIEKQLQALRAEAATVAN